MTYVEPHPNYVRPTNDALGDIFAELMLMDFAVTPAEREPNSYPLESRVLDPDWELDFREAIPDDVEAIIPVTWSLESFLGFPRPEDLDTERAIETAHVIIESFALSEAERLTTPEDPCYRAPYTYIDAVLRCSAMNETNYLRHGFLAICRNGIALIGCSLLWEPLPIHSIIDQNSPFSEQQPSISSQHRHLYTQMPLGTPGFDVVMLEYWAFNDISKVAASELLRFDGLATLLYATQGDYALQNDHYRTFVENQLKRPLPPLLHPGSTLPLYFPRNPLGDVHCAELFLSGLQDPFNFGDFFLHCFSHELSERVLAGWMPVVGTGMTPEGNFKMSTFNSSLGIELSSRQNMRSIYIESIFSELDFALQMIRERTSTSSVPENVIPENQNFVEQLQQLTALRTSGALTEEEFSAAKARLLGRQQD